MLAICSLGIRLVLRRREDAVTAGGWARRRNHAVVQAEPPTMAENEARPRMRRASARIAALIPGPAFVAAIAYVDPGNFATNFSSGSSYGYLLVWVVVIANAMAALIQFLSGKLGLATGRNLAELCRHAMPRWLTMGMWLQGELVAVATDLAEIIGGALALHLLFDIPLLPGGLITATVAFALLMTQRAGRRAFELVMAGALVVICVGFLFGTVVSGVDVGAATAGLAPRFADRQSMLLAAGIVGATVMPHAIYVHSALTQSSHGLVDGSLRRELLRRHRTDVATAMTFASLANLAMLMVAARVFYRHGAPGELSIQGAHDGLGTSVGAAVALAYAIALLISGIASSGVGTYAGQVIMRGFLRMSIPRTVRRVATTVPALVTLAVGIDPTQTLVISQVVLSFGIPFALIPLLMFTQRRDLMGDLVNRRSTNVLATAATALILALNVFLLAQLVT